jgi:hypothetical protein
MIDRFLASRPTLFFLAVPSFHAIFYGISAAECSATDCAGAVSRPQFPGGGADGRPSTGPYVGLRLSERFGPFQDLQHRLFEDGQHWSFVRGQRPSRLLGHVPVCVAARLAAHVPVCVAAQVAVKVVVKVVFRVSVR